MKFATHMKKHLIYISILIFFNSCSLISKKEDEGGPNELVVKLDWAHDQKIKFDETKYTRFLLYSKILKSPKIYKELLNSISNIPKLDSFMVVSLALQKFPSDYTQYKSGYPDKDILKSNHDHLKDTLLLNVEEPIHSELLALSGFRNETQIIIPDLNYNKDFSDDLEFNYPIEIKDIFTNDLDDKSNFSEIELSFQTIQNEKIYNLQRSVLIYPRANNKHIYLIDSGVLDTLTNQYSIMLEFLDYAKGNLSYGGIDYSIAIQGKSYENVVIVFKPENLKYEPNNQFLQQFLTFRLGDTITLGENSFVFEELTADFKKLNLEKIELHNNQEKDFSFENRFKNEKIEDFNRNYFDVLPINKEVPKYTLVEFWGTWCVPCLKLTPKIKDFNKNYGHIADVISIAYDDDIEAAESYVKRNNLKWKHGIVLRTERLKSIISKWDIKIFPTLLLFDKNNQFIYGGNSESALIKIDSIMHNISTYKDL